MMASGEFVLVEVIFVGEITVAVNVACIAAEDKHTALVDYGRMVIPGEGKEEGVGGGMR